MLGHRFKPGRLPRTAGRPPPPPPRRAAAGATVQAARHPGRVPALQGRARERRHRAQLVQGATALKGDPDETPRTMGGVTFAEPASETVADKRAQARMKGYVGEACPECGNFTMVRNGTCLKCETCGGTTGCS